MATIFAWVINQMDTKPQEGDLLDVVITVHWTRTAQDGDINVSSYGTMGCSTPSSTDFTAYPDLTYEQVCGWLNAGLSVTDIDFGLQQQINNIVNPPIINLPLPWATTTTTTTYTTTINPETTITTPITATSPVA